jgi:hypothetical protein
MRCSRICVRAADGPAGLRRCRLRQDGGRPARRLHRGDVRPSGRGRRADDAAWRASTTRPLPNASTAADQGRPCLAAGAGKGADKTKKGIADGSIDIVVGTHALLGKGVTVPRSRPADHRRGAAFRRQAQGAAEGAEVRRPCADALGNADPAHAAAGADRRARTVADRDAAGRPAGRAHLRLAL